MTNIEIKARCENAERAGGDRRERGRGRLLLVQAPLLHERRVACRPHARGKATGVGLGRERGLLGRKRRVGRGTGRWVASVAGLKRGLEAAPFLVLTVEYRAHRVAQRSRHAREAADEVAFVCARGHLRDRRVVVLAGEQDVEEAIGREVAVAGTAGAGVGALLLLRGVGGVGVRAALWSRWCAVRPGGAGPRRRAWTTRGPAPARSTETRERSIGNVCAR